MTLMTAWFFMSAGTIVCAMALRDIFTREVTARELLLLAFFTWTPRLACGGGLMPLLGSLSGAAVLWGLTTLARLFGRRDVIGRGDIYFAAAIGPWLSPSDAMRMVALAFLFACVPALIRVASQRRPGHLAFVPYLALAALLLAPWT